MTKEKSTTKGRRVAAKAKQAAGKIKLQKIDESGLTSRIRGHVSARGRRAQGKRDGR
jgi:hypothetical protein